MAKNDYFVIVYRILAYLYACFQAGENADIEMFGPEALKINNGYWTNVIESISHEGYITGVIVVPRRGSAPGIKLGNLKITQNGIIFLQENSLMEKAKCFLKEVKDVVPGL